MFYSTFIDILGYFIGQKCQKSYFKQKNMFFFVICQINNIFRSKGDPYAKKSKQNCYAILYNILMWRSIDSSRLDNHEYICFLFDKEQKNLDFC